MECAITFSEAGETLHDISADYIHYLAIMTNFKDQTEAVVVWGDDLQMSVRCVKVKGFNRLLSKAVVTNGRT